MSFYCPKCGRSIPEDSKICAYCGEKIPEGHRPVYATEIPDKSKDKTVLIVVLVVALLLIVPIAIAATVYVYVSGIGPSDYIDITPSVSMTAEPSTDNTKCTITIGVITEEDTSWLLVEGNLVDITEENIINLESYSWRPNGNIEVGDSIILDNSYIYPDFVDGNQYRFILTFMATGASIGTVTWTQ